MAINGNLSDLSLAELLQTISLSRKSGLLEICGENEIAWIGMKDGGVVRIALSGQDLDPDVMIKNAGLDAHASDDELDQVVWDAGIRTILSLFDWTQGEFNFDPAADPDSVWVGPPGLKLPTPLSPEYLALEGARIDDEDDGTGFDPDMGFDAAFPTEDESFGDPEPVPDPGLERVPDPVQTATPSEPLAEPLAEKKSLPVAIIAIDEDTQLLERLKRCASEAGVTVHRFSDPDLVLQRVQQYSLRGEMPAVVVGEGVGTDSHSPDRHWDTLIERVRRMSSVATILLLRTRKTPLTVSVNQSFEREDAQRSTPDERERVVDDLLAYLGIGTQRT